MLDTNKIASLINKGDSNPSIVSRNTGINYQTLKSKLKSDSWTPDDIEMLADYFKKPIGYFFGREENEENEKETDYNVKRIDCEDCIEKQKEIDKLKEKLAIMQEKYIDILERWADKKENNTNK